MDTSASKNPSQEIDNLDAERDCQRIAYLLTCQLFPYTIEKSLEYALFKTYAIPHISRILAATGEFTERSQKRYDDTVLILSEISENGDEHEKAKAAYQRLNEMHGRYRIRNGDFLYTLSTFVFEPIRALDLYGPRPMTDHEKQAWYNAYMRLGEGMGIKDLPQSLEAFQKWRQSYERDEFHYAPSNVAVADATMKVLMDMLRIPLFMRGFAKRVIIAIMEPYVAEAFGYERPSRPMQLFVSTLLQARRAIASRLPEGKKLRLQTERVLPSYPNGYLIEKLGTF